MLNPQEQYITLRNFLKKLLKVIREEASFTLINTKIVDKNRVDDVLCCIEGSIPKDYIAYTNRQGARSLKSQKLYEQLLEAIKNRFLFSTSWYAVKYKEAEQIINSLIVAYDNDIRFIYSNDSNMF